MDFSGFYCVVYTNQRSGINFFTVLVIENITYEQECILSNFCRWMHMKNLTQSQQRAYQKLFLTVLPKENLY